MDLKLRPPIVMFLLVAAGMGSISTASANCDIHGTEPQLDCIPPVRPIPCEDDPASCTPPVPCEDDPAGCVQPAPCMDDGNPADCANPPCDASAPMYECIDGLMPCATVDECAGRQLECISDPDCPSIHPLCLENAAECFEELCDRGSDANMVFLSCSNPCPWEPVACITAMIEDGTGPCNEVSKVYDITLPNGNYVRLYATLYSEAQPVQSGSQVHFHVSWRMSPDTITGGADTFQFAAGLHTVTLDAGSSMWGDHWADTPGGECIGIAVHNCMDLTGTVPAPNVVTATFGHRGAAVSTVSSTTRSVSHWSEHSVTAEANLKYKTVEGSLSYTYTTGTDHTWTDGTTYDTELLTADANAALRWKPNNPARSCVAI